MIPVLNKKTDKLPKGAVYIGRPSRFGNPFPVTKNQVRHIAVEKFQAYFLRRAKNDRVFMADLQWLKKNAIALVCFCAPLPCHGDVIAKYLDDMEA